MRTLVDCGCETKVYRDGSGVEVFYCDKHAACDEMLRVLSALDAFWGDGICDAPIWPGAYITEKDIPIRDVVHLAVNLAKGIVRP